MAPTKWGARQVQNLTAPSSVSGRLGQVTERLKRLFLAALGAFVVATTSPLYLIGTKLKSKQHRILSVKPKAPEASKAPPPPITPIPPAPPETPKTPPPAQIPPPPLELDKKLDEFTIAIEKLSSLTPMSEEWKKQLEEIHQNYTEWKRGIGSVSLKILKYASDHFGEDSYEWEAIFCSRAFIQTLRNSQAGDLNYTPFRDSSHSANCISANGEFQKKLRIMHQHINKAWESYVPFQFDKPLHELRAEFEAMATQIFDQKKAITLPQLQSFINACRLRIVDPAGYVRDSEVRDRLQAFLPYFSSGPHIQILSGAPAPVPEGYQPIAASVQTKSHSWALLKTLDELPHLQGKLSEIRPEQIELFEHPDDLEKNHAGYVDWRYVICVKNEFANTLKKELFEFKNKYPLPWYDNKCMAILPISLAMVAYRAHQMATGQKVIA